MESIHPICNRYLCSCSEYQRPSWDKVQLLSTVGRLEEATWMIQDLIGEKVARKWVSECSTLQTGGLRTYVLSDIKPKVIVTNDESHKTRFLVCEIGSEKYHHNEKRKTVPQEKERGETSHDKARKAFIECAMMRGSL